MKKTAIVLIGILTALPAAFLFAGQDQAAARATAYVQSVLDHQTGGAPPAGVISAPSAPALQRRNPRYMIGRDDVLTLTFPFTPEYNQTVTVQPDGYISLMGLPDMYVMGETVPELNKSLREAYSKFLHNPVIAISLTGFDKPSFIALGEVAKPGKYDLHGNLTVTEALAIAGGYTKEAKHSQVLLFHQVSGNWASVRVLNVKKMFNQRDLKEDVYLEPGDLIFVPKNLISKLEPYLPLNLFRINLGLYY